MMEDHLRTFYAFSLFVYVSSRFSEQHHVTGCILPCPSASLVWYNGIRADLANAKDMKKGRKKKTMDCLPLPWMLGGALQKQ